MSRAVAVAVVAVVTALAAPARAGGPEIVVVPAADHVVIHVSGVTPAGAPVASGGDRIDIPLVRGADHAGYQRLGDRTVRKVEVGDAHTPRLRLKLRTRDRATRALAAATTARAVADGIEIIVPRTPGATAAAPRPAAAAPVDAAAAPRDAAPRPAAAAAADAAPAPIGLAPAPSPAPAADAAPAARPVTGASSAAVPWGSLTLLGGVFAAAGLVVLRRRRRPGPRARALEVRSTMTLGNRARLVVLGVQDRELLLSVDGRGVRLIDSWIRDGGDDTAGALAGEPDPVDGPRAGRPRLATATVVRQSPSVSGLVALRQAASPDAGDDVDDAAAAAPPPVAGDDEAWARSILSSLRRGGLRS